MNQPGFDPVIAASASAEQFRAAQPDTCVFVEANAGSGKTRVLVDRVTNILLSDIPPDRILCITYTKAAAAEMQTRLFDRLGKWSVAGDDDLKADLARLGHESVNLVDLANARKLFARALETPGGLRIQTIHAFCERVLRYFPLEAGAPPGFDTLDDIAARDLAEAAKRAVLSTPDREALAVMLDRSGPDSIDQVFNFARFNRQALVRLIERSGGRSGVVERLYARLGVDPTDTTARLQAEAWQAAPKDRLKEAARLLADSKGATDKTFAATLFDALNAQTDHQSYTLYRSLFYTKKNELKVDITPATTARHHDWIEALFGSAKRQGYGTETLRIQSTEFRLKNLACAEGSRAALSLATDFITHYTEGLELRRALDFDDLIHLAGGLLAPDNAFAGWVSYKLDSRLAHILVDEAQDTAPAQWDMIAALSEEFFSGTGSDRASGEHTRTVFAVGDEKQSIYSFQGAAPDRFIAEGERLQKRAAAAGLKFETPSLNVSFRSAPDILAAVDEAFADLAQTPEPLAPEVKFQAPPFLHYSGHAAARRHTPGRVEFWPAVPRPEKTEETSILDPVDARQAGSSVDVLARTVAERVRTMIETGETVWHETDGGGFEQRPVEPRDIALLVWRRTGGFFEEVIRQLKIHGLPVAGADRMVLRDQTAVRDILSLLKFAVTPSDDLALAEVLKSPFFDPADSASPLIDDDVLLALTQTRQNTRRGGLWAALLRSEDGRLQEARDALVDVRNRADRMPHYALIADFLNARTPTGETRWTRVFARLGEEARDPLEECLSRALDFQNRDSGSLARFIATLEADDTQIKREQAGDRNEIQVMTVHGAKGLEWPVVILPDTTRSPGRRRDPGFFLHPDAGFLWSPRKAEDPLIVSDWRETLAARERAENERLLYVALTRARDHLIVCGWRHGLGSPGKVDEDSWYARLERQWSDETWADLQTPLHALYDDLPAGKVRGPDRDQLTRAAAVTPTSVSLPDWATQLAPQEAGRLVNVNPSRDFGEAGLSSDAVNSPLSDPDGYRFRRGDVIHKLLETLPSLPDARRAEAAARYLDRQTDLAETQRSIILEETLGILSHPDFAPLFGPDSQAEVSLSGRAPGLRAGATVRGQVDRLVVTDHSVLIIDYKTNRPAAATVEEVSPLYIGQMAAYRQLLRALYPHKTVICSLLWTDTAQLMTLPDEILDRSLNRSTP